MYKHAFYLAKKELGYHWKAIIFTIFVTMFFGVFTAFLLAESIVAVFGEETSYNRIVIDLILLGLTPSFAAIFMSGPYLSFQTIKEDTYSKRMAYLRSLPIPVKVLALSRTMVMLITLIIMSSVFYITISFMLPDHFYDMMTQGEFLLFIIAWFSYALALGGMNPYIEYGTSGKVLHAMPFVFLGIFFVSILLFYRFINYGAVEVVLFLIKDIGWPVAVISFFIGMICCYIWNKLLTTRLQKRDYL